MTLLKELLSEKYTMHKDAPIDDKYVYRIHKSYDDGKTWEFNKGDEYQSLADAKDVKTSMLKPKAIGKKIKITKHKREKLSGPKGTLPK